MYRTFSLKGTKEGLLLLVKENDDYELFYRELEECFSADESASFLISSIEIKGESLPLLVRSTAEHLIRKYSSGRINIKSEHAEVLSKKEYSFCNTLRSGECLEFKTSVLLRGSVHSGAILITRENAFILENLCGIVSVPEGKQIYVGGELRGQIRIGGNVYFPSLTQKSGIWLYEKDGKLIIEDNGGNRIDGRSICGNFR